VSDHVPHPYAPAYSTKNVASGAEVWALADAMSGFVRTSSDPAGRPVKVDGDRYAALVALAGRHGPRPEESIALRHSCVRFEPARVVVELREAEVEVPKRLTGAAHSRMVVPLKHRMPGAVRRFDITDPREVALFRRHFARYVPKPDLASADPDRRDPRVFTTHRGAPVDLGNFGEAWWKPVVEQCFAHSAKTHLRTLQFRELRAAAITSWLVDGWSLYRCAQKAGKSPGVIEKHYAGVLSDVGYEHHQGRAAAPMVAPELGALSDTELVALAKAVGAERHQRVDEELGENS